MIAREEEDKFWKAQVKENTQNGVGKMWIHIQDDTA
jgi:hypothetical protein